MRDARAPGQGMRVLVTGGSGFIGRRLVERALQRGDEVVALTRPEGARRPLPGGVREWKADLTDAEAVRAAMTETRPEVIFHAAMPSGHPLTPEDRLGALTTAVTGTAALAEGAAQAGVTRFVHFGSFLGYKKQTRAIVETDPIEPQSARGAAKAAASIWLGQFARERGFPSVELRIFSVYGPGEPADRFIPTLLRAALDGSAVPLLRGPSRDLVHVDDVVDACDLAARASVTPGAVFNIGGGRSWRNEDVVEAVSRAVGRPIPVTTMTRPPKAADGLWLADIRAAVAGLGWTPRRELEAEVAELLRGRI